MMRPRLWLIAMTVLLALGLAYGIVGIFASSDVTKDVGTVIGAVVIVNLAAVNLANGLRHR